MIAFAESNRHPIPTERDRLLIFTTSDRQFSVHLTKAIAYKSRLTGIAIAIFPFSFQK